MTRIEARTIVWGWLDDPQGAYFTEALVNTWLNLAQREVQKRLLQAGQNWYMKPVQTTTVASQADYVLPSDFLVEHRIEIVISGTGVNENRQPLEAITLNQQDQVSIGLGVPTNYYIKKDRVTLSPTPQQAYTMRLYYSPRVSDLTQDTDTFDVPEQFVEYVPIVAALNGFIKDDRAPDNLLIKKKEYEDLLKQSAVGRTQDSSRRVVSRNTFDRGWY